MTLLTADRLEIQVLVDNVTDSLSSHAALRHARMGHAAPQGHAHRRRRRAVLRQSRPVAGDHGACAGGTRTVLFDGGPDGLRGGAQRRRASASISARSRR